VFGERPVILGSRGVSSSWRTAEKKNTYIDVADTDTSGHFGGIELVLEWLRVVVDVSCYTGFPELLSQVEISLCITTMHSESWRLGLANPSACPAGSGFGETWGS
jgi:hypothetical protein